MSQKIAVGIDIGSAIIKVVVVESVKDDPRAKPRIIGVGYSEAEGLRHGYIINPEETAKSLRKAVNEAQKTSGYKIEKAYFGIGSVGLQGTIHSASVSFGNKDITIGANELEQVLEQCQNEIPETDIKNREILHAIPLGYKIDGKQIFGKPQGMVGNTIEVKAFFVTALSQHLASLLETVRLASLDIEDITASPVASSIALLSKSQQIAGCGLLTVGAETITLGVFENGVPICVEVLPIGSRDITNDIALGFKVSLEEADRIKISRPESLPYPRRKIEEIIKARLEDVSDFTQSSLKKIGKNGLLPAGILVTGGGALSHYIEDLLKDKLKLSTKKIGIKFTGESKYPINDGTWSIAYGLATIGIESGDESGGRINLGGTFMNNARHGFEKSFRNILKIIKKILP